MNDPTRSISVTVEMPLPNGLLPLRVQYSFGGGHAGSLSIGLAVPGTTERVWSLANMPPLPGEAFEPLARILKGLDAFSNQMCERDCRDGTDLEGSEL